MASSALISYPCFKDLEKSNTNFVEPTSSYLQKYRRSRRDKKENLNVEYKRESPAPNTTRITKKKDVEILPTLNENEEKEENRMPSKETGKIFEELITHFDKKITNEEVNANSMLPSPEGERKANSKFSNYTLVHDTFAEPPTSEYSDAIKRRIANSKSELLVGSPITEQSLKSAKSLTESRGNNSIYDRSNMSKNETITLNGRLAAVNGEPCMTLMPNTSEFEVINFDESLQQSTECPTEYTQKLEEDTPKIISESGSVLPKRIARNWIFILAATWVLFLAAALTYVTVNITTKSDKIQEDELKNLNLTNYEICLLIGRNVRRLIASSIYSVNPYEK